MLKIILALTLIPVIELSLLYKISQSVGVIFAISLVIFTGILGGILMSKQGTKVIRKIQESLSQGIMPADSIIDGFTILLGGALLITPGTLTDLTGFLCIIPLTRNKIAGILKKKFSKVITEGKFQFTPPDSKKTKTINVVKDKEE